MKNILNFLSKKQYRIQCLIFWIMAILNYRTDRFWVFAAIAILFGGLQDIIEELRNTK